MRDPVLNLDLRSVRVQTWSHSDQVILQGNSGSSQSKTMSGVLFIINTWNSCWKMLILKKKKKKARDNFGGLPIYEPLKRSLCILCVLYAALMFVPKALSSSCALLVSFSSPTVPPVCQNQIRSQTVKRFILWTCEETADTFKCIHRLTPPISPP